jgi:hypothetical protein
MKQTMISMPLLKKACDVNINKNHYGRAITDGNNILNDYNRIKQIQQQPIFNNFIIMDDSDSSTDDDDE